MSQIPAQHPRSVLFITLDSCRYDTFVSASAPNLKAVGQLHRAMSPGSFTYASHAAMFVGFTPGIAQRAEPFINPKFSKIFKMTNAGFPGKGSEYMTLEGRNIIDGFKRKGYLTLGVGAVGWFDPGTETGEHLSREFDHFYYPGNNAMLDKQLAWLAQHLSATADVPVLAFLNIGETHVPYYFEGAPWPASSNPCVPFGKENDADECRRRQRACLEFIDGKIGTLLEAFGESTTLICADHGDCWGEDGLWEHGIHHEKVFEVPLLFRLGDASNDQ